MYLTAIRPNTIFTVSLLARIMDCSIEMHLYVAKGIVRYIKGTVGYDVKFKTYENFKLYGFSYSDFVGSTDDMKSTSRYCFNLGSRISLGVSRSIKLWQNPRQRINSLQQQQ